MSATEGTKKDYLFAWIGFVLLVAAFGMVFAAIWVDIRWAATSFFSFIISVLCFVISSELDTRWAKEGRKP